MQEKVAAIGFHWRNAAGAKRKVDEEIAETEREAVDGTPESLEEEYGDLLFTLDSQPSRRSMLSGTR